MKARLLLAIAVPMLGWAAVSASAQGPNPPSSVPAKTSPSSEGDRRAEAYYNFAMGHLYKQEYVTSSRSEDANRAIEFYKKAYALDPASQVIGEQLARMYFLAQRTRDAVSEIQEMLSRNPSNVSARRLLARIYLRTLGDLSNASRQGRIVSLAIEQLREIVRLDPSDTDSALWLARLERRIDQHDNAEQVLRGILERDARNEAAVKQLTRLLLDENRAEEAISLLQGILEHAPSAAFYDQLGDAYTQMQDPEKAVEAYRNAVELEPGQGNYRRRLAESLFDLREYEQAMEQYQKLADREPNEAENYLRLSEIYRRLRRLDQAEEHILLAKKRAPGSLEVIYNEAMIYQEQGRFEDAIRVLSGAVTTTKGQIAVTPERRRTLAILYQVLGQLYGDTGNTASAISSFQELAQLGPEEDRRARVLMIETYRGARDLPHAFAVARKALEDYPDDRALRTTQALLYGKNNQPDEAAQILRAMLDNSAADLEVYLNLAQVYEQARRFSDAEQSLRAAEATVQQPSGRELIHFQFGAIYERQKKYEQAEEAFEAVLAINPRNALALNYYGYMLAEQGLRLDEAVSLVERALAEDPSNGAYLDSIGWAYYKQGKLADAEEYLHRAVGRIPRNPTIRSHLGDVLAKRGHMDLAVTEWERALADWHRTAPVEFEADQIAELEQKISTVKQRVAQQKKAAETKP